MPADGLAVRVSHSFIIVTVLDAVFMTVVMWQATMAAVWTEMASRGNRSQTLATIAATAGVSLPDATIMHDSDITADLLRWIYSAADTYARKTAH